MRDRIDLKIGYNGEGYSTVVCYTTKLFDVSSGLTQTRQKVVNISLFYGIHITACGEFAQNILRCVDEKKDSEIIKMCLERVVSDIKLFTKFIDNVYNSGFEAGKIKMRSDIQDLILGKD